MLKYTGILVRLLSNARPYVIQKAPFLPLSLQISSSRGISNKKRWQNAQFWWPLPPMLSPPQFKSLPQAFHLFAQTQLLAGTSSLPAYKLYNLSALVPTGCVTSLTLISGFGELTLVLLCSNNPVLLLFQFDFICLTVPMRKPIIRLQKTF